MRPHRLGNVTLAISLVLLLYAVCEYATAQTQQQKPSPGDAAQQDAQRRRQIFIEPWETWRNKFRELFGSWRIHKPEQRSGSDQEIVVALEDEKNRGAILVRCVAKHPDLLIALDRKYAIINGSDVVIHIKPNGNSGKQFLGRIVGDRFVLLDDTVGAISQILAGPHLSVGLEASGLQLLFEFDSKDSKLALSEIISTCKISIS
jgi:hypothetical protein